MRRMGRSVSFGYEIARRDAVGAHTPHAQGLTEVQVRSLGPIPATETSQRCHTFLLVPRMCKSLAVLGYVASVHPDRELDPRFHADVAGRRLRWGFERARGPAWRALPLPCSGVLPILPDLRC